MVRLYMDDVRPCPDGWTAARTVEEAQVWLSAHAVDACSLDHDMGACDACIATGAHVGDMATPETTFLYWCPHVMDGTKLVRWMVETGNWSTQKPTVHSMNPAGAKRMRDLIDQFYGHPAYGPMF